MKKYHIILFILLLSFFRNEAQTWNLVWSDEFTETSIQSSNWNFETGSGGWGNSELEYYTNRTDNATISNGNLLIIAKQESYNGSNYTSARMNTSGLHSWTYGKVEASIKLPSGQGLWPAFWMLGNNISQVSWPQCGEIDIMERINTAPTLYGTMHWENNGAASYGGNTPIPNPSQYHLYSVEWDSASIVWYLDGTQYWSGNIANNINNTNAFHEPFYILLNMAVGGTWPGNPDGTSVFPDTMYIDYVRVYQTGQMTQTVTKSNIMNDIHITPNPGRENFNIAINEIPAGKTVELNVYNQLGEKVYTNSQKTMNETYQSNIDASGLAAGVYIVRIQTDTECWIEKIIKQ
jgi:beta-glucanase (GH16 family)